MTRYLAIPLLLSAILLAQPATNPSADVQIQALIRQLSHEDFQTRQDAQDQLITYAQQAKPHLEALIKSTTDPEARTRAESALAQIEENRSTGPSLVTLHLKDASPETVLQELSRQANFPIPTMPENLFKQEHLKFPPLTLDLDRQPFLLAMRQFCEKTGLRPNPMGNDRKFVIMQGGDDAMFGPAVYPGAFMVVANSVTRSASITFGRDKGPSKNMNLQLTFYAEPKLNLMGHDYFVRLTEATDDRGNSLLIPTPRMQGSMGQDTSPRWSLNASLAIPDNLGTKLVRLKGSNRVLMQTRSETWEIPDVSQAQTPSRSIAGRKYVVEGFKSNGADQYQFSFTMIREVPQSEPWQQFGRGVRVSLLDPDGKPLSPRGYGGGGSDEKITHTYTFSRDTDNGQKTGPAAKLVVEVPTEVREQDVPFEFTDLPLP